MRKKKPIKEKKRKKEKDRINSEQIKRNMQQKFSKVNDRHSSDTRTSCIKDE